MDPKPEGEFQAKNFVEGNRDLRSVESATYSKSKSSHVRKGEQQLSIENLQIAPSSISKDHLKNPIILPTF